MTNVSKRPDPEYPNKVPAESRITGTSLLLANSLASVFPGVGGLTSEVIGKFREKRIRQFVEMLAERISDLEERQELFTQPACIELLEEAAKQAAYGEKDLKRTALARLMAASINDDLVNHETDRLLLTILREMTDYELLHLLKHFENTQWELDYVFENILVENPDVLQLRASHMGSSQDQSDLHQVQKAHRTRLERLGLLVNEGQVDRPRYNSTPIGRLLLRRIGAITHPND